MMRFRESGPAVTPAKAPNSPQGTVRAKLTMPACAGECVTASTRRGYAIAVDCEPIVESVCPTWRSTKSRLRRRGTTGTPSRMFAAATTRALGSAEHPEVAADCLAAQHERRAVGELGGAIAAERDLGAQVARHRTGIHVEVRARRDADLDVA